MDCDQGVTGWLPPQATLAILDAPPPQKPPVWEFRSICAPSCQVMRDAKLRVADPGSVAAKEEKDEW
eukprot:7801733-Lingulodinium_polyedra.AAC.1